MSTTQIIILVVVIVVVLLLAAAVLAFLRRRTKLREERRGHAGQLRQQAGTQTPRVQDALVQADQAEAEAARLRARADEAEAEAARLRRSAAAEEATQEDQVREADRLDPDVDTKAKDYAPVQGFAEPAPVDPASEEAAPPDPMEGGSEHPTHTPPVTGPGGATAEPGAHRGEPAVTPEADPETRPDVGPGLR